MKTTANNQATNGKQIFSNSYRNRPQPTETQLSAIRQKREKLKADSAALQELVKQGHLESVNEGLIGIYHVQGHTELKTLTEWNKAGYWVNKGEKALLLWGSKRTSVPRAGEENTDPYDFFPICHVFSNLQVTEKSDKNVKN